MRVLIIDRKRIRRDLRPKQVEAGADDFMQLKANKYHFTKNNGGPTYVGINNSNQVYAVDVTGQIHTSSGDMIDGTIKIAGKRPGESKTLTSNAMTNIYYSSLKIQSVQM